MEQRGIAITRCPFVCTDKFSSVNKRLLLLAMALMAVCPQPGAGQRAGPAPVPAAVSEFFRTGVVLQDRNGDGAIDFVDARIVLVRTRHNGAIVDQPASLSVFDHAITYVPELDMYLDGTAEHSGVAVRMGSVRGLLPALALQVRR